MGIILGEYNNLEIIKKVDFGVYLDGKDDGEILLPAKLVPEGYKVGDIIKVFIYLDNEERLIATTETPKTKVGDFAFLEVAWTNNFGAFLNWGLLKDLFVPFSEQEVRMEKGHKYVVYVTIDSKSHRIIASAKIDKFLSKGIPPYHDGDEVEFLIYKMTDLGWKAVVDNAYSGLVFKNEVFKTIRTGDKLKAFVKKVRPDGKIDLTLQKQGNGAIDDVAQQILSAIEDNGGFLPMGDNSSPEEIYSTFGISKKAFKRAIGKLYKEHKIKIDDGLRLV